MLSNTNPTTAPKSTILHIISYALRGPPLDFEPDVHINARRLINPPSELRKAFDGRCEGLRKNLRADPAFHELLAEAQPRIFQAEEKRRALIINAEDHTVRMVEVRVAVACVRGRHRSAAIAEELAKLLVWPEHYEVRVYHRDVDTPHRYQKWHQQNLEREQRGETVDPELPSAGSDDSDDEDSFDSQSTSEEDRRRSEAEPRSTAWWEDCRSELYRVGSHDILKPENSGNPRNPLHIPLLEHGGATTSQPKDHQHTMSENPQHAFTTQRHELQHPSSGKPGPAVAQVQATQHNQTEAPHQSVDAQKHDLQHTVPEKHEEPAVVQVQTVQQISPEKHVEIQSAPQSVPTDRGQGAAEEQKQPPQHTSIEKPEIPAVTQTQTVQQIPSEKLEHPTDLQTQVSQNTTVVKAEAPVVAPTQPNQTQPNQTQPVQTQPVQPAEPEKHDAPAVAQTQTAQPVASIEPDHLISSRPQADSQHGSS